MRLLVHLEKQKGRNLKPVAQKVWVTLKKKQEEEEEKNFEHEKMKT